MKFVFVAHFVGVVGRRVQSHGRQGLGLSVVVNRDGDAALYLQRVWACARPLPAHVKLNSLRAPRPLISTITLVARFQTHALFSLFPCGCRPGQRPGTLPGAYGSAQAALAAAAPRRRSEILLRAGGPAFRAAERIPACGTRYFESKPLEAKLPALGSVRS